MKTIVGVMGSGSVIDQTAYEVAYRTGALIAERGWVLLNGGRACGIMDASSRGAKEAGGLVVGVLPDADAKHASKWLDIPVRTGLGDARNAVNALTSDVVIALPGGAGTLSEVALALKSGRPVVSVGFRLGEAFDPYVRRGLLTEVSTPEEAIAKAATILGGLT